MVTILPPKENGFADFAGKLSGGLAEGYMNRADQKAIQKAIEDLGPQATMQDTIKALTAVNTYNPESKKMAVENIYKSMGVDLQATAAAETKRHNLASEGKALLDKEKELNSSKFLIQNSALDDEKKAALMQEVESGAVSYDAVKNALKPPKAPKTLAANEPTTEEQLERINAVTSTEAFKKGNNVEKRDLLRNGKVSNPNITNVMAPHEKQAELDIEKTKADRKEELTFHKESAKFDEKLQEHYQSAVTQLDAIKDVEKALDTGNVSPFSAANLFSHFGPIGQVISDALINKDQAVLKASIPAFLEGRKELFGVRLSDADLKLLQDKLPDITKNEAANRAILELMKKYSQKAITKYQAAKEIKSETGGLRPINYAERVTSKAEEIEEKSKKKKSLTSLLD